MVTKDSGAKETVGGAGHRAAPADGEGAVACIADDQVATVVPRATIDRCEAGRSDLVGDGCRGVGNRAAIDRKGSRAKFADKEERGVVPGSTVDGRRAGVVGGITDDSPVVVHRSPVKEESGAGGGGNVEIAVRVVDDAVCRDLQGSGLDRRATRVAVGIGQGRGAGAVLNHDARSGNRGKVRSLRQVVGADESQCIIVRDGAVGRECSSCSEKQGSRREDCRAGVGAPSQESHRPVAKHGQAKGAIHGVAQIVGEAVIGAYVVEPEGSTGIESEARIGRQPLEQDLEVVGAVIGHAEGNGRIGSDHHVGGLPGVRVGTVESFGRGKVQQTIGDDGRSGIAVRSGKSRGADAVLGEGTGAHERVGNRGGRVIGRREPRSRGEDAGSGDRSIPQRDRAVGDRVAGVAQDTAGDIQRSIRRSQGIDIPKGDLSGRDERSSLIAVRSGKSRGADAALGEGTGAHERVGNRGGRVIGRGEPRSRGEGAASGDRSISQGDSAVGDRVAGVAQDTAGHIQRSIRRSQGIDIPKGDLSGRDERSSLIAVRSGKGRGAGAALE